MKINQTWLASHTGPIECSMTARGRASRTGRLPYAAALLAVAAAGLLAWWWLRTPAFAVAVRADRNVLVITIDTLRGDALGSYGGRAATTPQLRHSVGLPQ